MKLSATVSICGALLAFSGTMAVAPPARAYDPAETSYMYDGVFHNFSLGAVCDQNARIGCHWGDTASYYFSIAGDWSSIWAAPQWYVNGTYAGADMECADGSTGNPNWSDREYAPNEILAYCSNGVPPDGAVAYVVVP